MKSACLLVKKSYIIVKYWAVEDASPYNLAILSECFVGDGVPDVPKLVFRQIEADIKSAFDHFFEFLSAI